MQLDHRHAEPRDLESVFNLYMDESANPFLTYDPMTLTEFSLIYQSMLSDGNVYVVESNNETVATYRLIHKTYRQAHIVYLGGFAVKQSQKGKGLGTAILEHIKKTVRERSISRIELTVDTENTAAINLYRKVGFEIEGKLKNNYKLSSTGEYYDEYIMALLLR